MTMLRGHHDVTHLPTVLTALLTLFPSFPSPFTHGQKTTMDKPIEHSHESARGSGVDKPAPHAAYRTRKRAEQNDYLAEASGLPGVEMPNQAHEEKMAGKSGGGGEGGGAGGKTEGADTGRDMKG